MKVVNKHAGCQRNTAIRTAILHHLDEREWQKGAKIKARNPALHLNDNDRESGDIRNSVAQTGFTLPITDHAFTV